jgi:hypothetical protein
MFLTLHRGIWKVTSVYFLETRACGVAAHHSFLVNHLITGRLVFVLDFMEWVMTCPVKFALLSAIFMLKARELRKSIMNYARGLQPTFTE